MSNQNLYCFVDETGQDTKGKLFSVCCTLVVSFELMQELERLILKIEDETGKKSKWQQTNLRFRILFLEALIKYKDELKGHIFIEHFYDIGDFLQATVESICKSIKKSQHNDKAAIIYIDGLSKSLVKKVSVMIRCQGIKTEKVKGLKDGQSSLIRLCDAIVGFVRDYLEAQDYTKKYYLELLKSGVIIEV